MARIKIDHSHIIIHTESNSKKKVKITQKLTVINHLKDLKAIHLNQLPLFRLLMLIISIITITTI